MDFDHLFEKCPKWLHNEGRNDKTVDRFLKPGAHSTHNES